MTTTRKQAFYRRHLGTSPSQIIGADDFSSSAGTEASSVIGELGWFANIDGTTGDDAVGIDGVLDHPGIQSIGAGTTSGNDWAIALCGGTNALTFMDFNQPNWSMTSIYRVPTITSITVRVGIAENIVGASWEGADNAFFKFDPAVSANWQCVSFASAAQTTTTGVVANASQWYKQKIVKDGSTIRFYLDDVNVANHSTQLPVATVCSPALQVQTNTTVLRAIQIDYFRLSMILAR